MGGGVTRKGTHGSRAAFELAHLYLGLLLWLPIASPMTSCAREFRATLYMMGVSIQPTPPQGTSLLKVILHLSDKKKGNGVFDCMVLTALSENFPAL